MRVVLSRKGFDSKYGGMASPILPDGRLFPLPIPSKHDNATLGDLPYADLEMAGIISDLSNGRHTLATGIHRDPDLDRPISADLSNWRPTLGQTGAAQSHLSTKGIGRGDLFLFFGWFRLIEQVGGRWRYAKSTPDLHVLFGWLEVDEVLPIVTARSTALQRHPWIANHPHVASPDWYTSPLNTLYIGRERSFYGPDGTFGGWAVFNHAKSSSTDKTWLLPQHMVAPIMVRAQRSSTVELPPKTQQLGGWRRFGHAALCSEGPRVRT
jgi:hypothetical protein